jgi:hypothetical protein
VRSAECGVRSSDPKRKVQTANPDRQHRDANRRESGALQKLEEAGNGKMMGAK